MAKEAAPVATAKERDVRPPAVDAFFRRYLFCFGSSLSGHQIKTPTHQATKQHAP